MFNLSGLEARLDEVEEKMDRIVAAVEKLVEIETARLTTEK